MTHQTFKKAAKLENIVVYSARKYSNKNGTGYTVIYAHQLSENTVSTEEKRHFHEMSLSEILENNFYQI